jgi:DNA-binding protein
MTTSSFNLTNKKEIVELIKDRLILEIQDKEINKQLLFKLLVIAMEAVEKTTSKGVDQKEIVKETLIEILNLDHVQVLHKEHLISFLQEDLDNVIELIVDATKGKLNINKIEIYTTSCIACFFSCIRKKLK